MFKHLFLLATLLLTGFWFITQVVQPASHRLTHGFGAYYTASRLLRQGEISHRIYDPDYFRPLVRADSQQQTSDIYNANPPTMSLMFWPLSFLTVEQARIVWSWANALMLWTGLVVLILGLVDRPTLLTVVPVLSLGMLFQPAIANIKFGQAYLLIFLLLTVAVVAWFKRSDGLGGAALAITILLKAVGWMLIPLLLYHRRWRFLAWTVAVSMAMLLLTFPYLPGLMWPRYLALLLETVKSPLTCVTAYQTTRSLLCHLFVFDQAWNSQPIVHMPWLASGLFAGLAICTLAVIYWLNRKNEYLAVMGILVWILIFAPLGEQHHHTIMLIPITYILVNWQSEILNPVVGKVCAAVAIAAYLVPFQIGHARFHDGWWALLAYPRVYSAWLILVALCSSLLTYHKPRFLHGRLFKIVH